MGKIKKNKKIFDSPDVDAEVNKNTRCRVQKSETMNSCDSDSAPEDIGFNESKVHALDRLMNTRRLARETKNREKLRRQKHHNQYLEQRNQRVRRLEDSKLPDSFLDHLTSKSQLADVNKEDNGENRENSSDDQEIEDEDDMDKESGYAEEDSSNTDLQGYIPLTGHAVPRAALWKDEDKKRFSSMEKAMMFKKGRQFGNLLTRQPSAVMMSQRMKRTAAKRKIK